MLTVETPKALLQLVGRELGPSEWTTVDQATIDTFAEATGDHQTIAHGYLTLSLVPRLAATLLETACA